MKFKITISPIDISLQKYLRIHRKTLVNNSRVGAVLNRLAEKGYVNISTNVEDKIIHMHCEKRCDENNLEI